MELSGGKLALGAVALLAAAGWARSGGLNQERALVDVSQVVLNENAHISEGPLGHVLVIQNKRVGPSFKGEEAVSRAVDAFRSWCDLHGVWPTLYYVGLNSDAWVMLPGGKAQAGSGNEEGIRPSYADRLAAVRPGQVYAVGTGTARVEMVVPQAQQDRYGGAVRMVWVRPPPGGRPGSLIVRDLPLHELRELLEDV